MEDKVYIYKGFVIRCMGYLSKYGKYEWIAIDKNGIFFAQALSLRAVKEMINSELKNRHMKEACVQN